MTPDGSRAGRAPAEQASSSLAGDDEAEMRTQRAART